MTIPFEESRSLVSEPLHVVSSPQTSSAIVHFEPCVLGGTLETDHVKVEDMELSASEEMDGSGTSSLLPDFTTDKVTELLTEILTSSQAFVEDPTIAGPLSGRTSKESVKLAGETINWLSDPLAALAGLIPMTLTTDTVALSPKETMNKMSHHFLDVSFLSFHSICMTGLTGFK
jgi:hypothetical protein